MKTKCFRISDLVYRIADSSHHVHLVATDGEFWGVRIDMMKDWEEIWRFGMILELPMVLVTDGRGDRRMEPDWSKFNSSEAYKFYPTDTHAMISRMWGRETADRFCPPDKKPTSIFPPPETIYPMPLELEPPKRKVRKPKSKSSPSTKTLPTNKTLWDR